MFSQTVEYSLRAAAFLAAESPESRTTSQIAAATKVPEAYLAKVLQALRRAGIVHSLRGAKGGVVLAIAPTELTILEVVNAVDSIKRITTCPLGLESHGTDLCPLHRRLDQALASVQEAFSSSTLAEILNEPTGSIPLCDFPPKCVPARDAQAK